MAFFAQTGPEGYAPLGSSLGVALGEGISDAWTARQAQQQQQQQASILSKVLTGQASPEEIAQLDPQMQLEVSKLAAQRAQQQQKQLAEQQKMQQEQAEAQILSKFQRGEELTPQETAQLSPTSLRTLIGQEKKMFEPTEEKLEAERVSALASEIEKNFQTYQAEDQRLGRMEELSERGQLTTPLMKKALDIFGLPLGVLNDPKSEEYQKLETDYLRDVRNVFPGRVTNFEVQSYMKGIPSLFNTPEGRKAIIRNRRLVNEAYKVKYEAYKDILKENGGRKPRNMGILIEERTGQRLNELADEFREGITKSIEPHMTMHSVRSPTGTVHKVPSNRLKDVIEAGGELL